MAMNLGATKRFEAREFEIIFSLGDLYSNKLEENYKAEDQEIN